MNVEIGCSDSNRPVRSRTFIGVGPSAEKIGELVLEFLTSHTARVLGH